jgi:hypothetical protein
MRAAVVIADVLAQDALGVALAEDHDVVETVAVLRRPTSWSWSDASAFAVISR